MSYRRMLFLSSALTVVLSQMTWSGSDLGSGEPTSLAPVISSPSQGAQDQWDRHPRELRRRMIAAAEARRDGLPVPVYPEASEVAPSPSVQGESAVVDHAAPEETPPEGQAVTMPEEANPVAEATAPSSERPAPSFDGDGLVGTVGLTPVLRMMENLPLQDAVNLLSTNRAYRDNFELWRGLANIHQVSIPENITTAAGVRGVLKSMIEEFRGDLQHLTPETYTPELITSFLERAQRYPFLWPALVETLQEFYISMDSEHVAVNDVIFGRFFFEGVSESLRRAYLEALLAQQYDNNKKEMIQEKLIKAAAGFYIRHGVTLGFTPDRGTPTSSYDYLERIAGRTNPDGTPGLMAESAQFRLIEAAFHRKLGFTNDHGTPTSGYDYLVEVAARTNPDGTPGVGAEYAQIKLNDAANLRKLGFTYDRGTPTSAYDYLERVAARVNPDGTPGVGAEDAQGLLRNFGWG